MKKGLLIYTTVFVLIILAGGVLLLNNSKNNSKEEAKQTFNSEQFNWQENGKKGTYIVKIKSGSLSSPVKAKVLTDDNCDPDSKGLSHCNVVVALQNEKQIKFVMTHNMMNYPCLNLQSTIELSPYREGYAKVKI
ncbi:hypothetical protein ACE38V_22070 [Cytobacillus sp. Hz8]|uniref:hypothetical protein n=1 Tax=Cytobacillus sp. Hz8 TaxID=3347168 RepID=UPI0035D748DE